MRGTRTELEGCSAYDSVEPSIAECDAIAGDFRRKVDPSRFAFHSPHFEYVGEIGTEVDMKRSLDAPQAVVFHAELLVVNTLPQECAKSEKQGAERKPQFIAIQLIGVRQRHRQLTILGPG